MGLRKTIGVLAISAASLLETNCATQQIPPKISQAFSPDASALVMENKVLIQKLFQNALNIEGCMPSLSSEGEEVSCTTANGMVSGKTLTDGGIEVETTTISEGKVCIVGADGSMLYQEIVDDALLTSERPAGEIPPEESARLCMDLLRETRELFRGVRKYPQRQ